jgi:hypothetical protein
LVTNVVVAVGASVSQGHSLVVNYFLTKFLYHLLQDIAVHDPGFCQFKTLTEYFPVNAPVFMLGWPHYGCQGEVIETDMESGRVRINLTIFEEPKLGAIMNDQQVGVYC